MLWNIEESGIVTVQNAECMEIGTVMAAIRDILAYLRKSRLRRSRWRYSG
jgi:hypothetical protein